MTTTTQFKQVRTPSGRVAYEAWTAVYDRGQHIAISAPTLAQLEQAWKDLPYITQPFQPAMAQHTWIVKFEDRSDASL